MSRIITVHSYSGGTGVTTTTAGLATIFREWGARVLCVDTDMDTPGLHRHLARIANDANVPMTGLSDEAGLIELFERLALGQPIDWRNYVQVFEPDGRPPLHFLSSGALTSGYTGRARSLNWDRLYADHGLGNLVEDWIEQWHEDYDVVLIDTGSGVTPVAGFCLVQVPDIVVSLVQPNQRSLRGTARTMRQAMGARNHLPVDKAGLLVLPVVSKLDQTTDPSLRREWVAAAAETVAPLCRPWRPRNLETVEVLNVLTIPYAPAMTLGDASNMPFRQPSEPSLDPVESALTTVAAFLNAEMAGADLLADDPAAYRDRWRFRSGGVARDSDRKPDPVLPRLVNRPTRPPSLDESGRLGWAPRTYEMGVLRQRVQHLTQYPSQLMMIELTGSSGSGKSQILKQLKSEVSADGELRTALVDLRGESMTSATGPLDGIYRDLGLECVLYAYNRTRLQEAMNQALYLTEGDPIRSLLVDAGLASLTGPLPPGPVGAALLDELYRLAPDARTETVLDELDEAALDADRLRELLPISLAVDLRRLNRFDRPGRHGLVLFYDTWSPRSVREVGKPTAGSAEGLNWLGSFIGELGMGLHVFASRASLRDEVARWRNVAGGAEQVGLERLTVERLTANDAERLVVSAAPQLDDEHIHRLLEVSDRSPFLIASALWALDHVEEQEVWHRALTDGESILEMMMDLLPASHRSMVEALAAIGAFDQGLFDHLREELNIHTQSGGTDEALSAQDFNKTYRFVDRSPRSAGTTVIYRIQDRLIDHIWTSESYDHGLALEALTAATDYLLRRLTLSRVDRSGNFRLVEAILNGWARLPAIPTAAIEQLVDIGYELHDSGYWLEMGTMEIDAGPGHPVDTVLRFFEGLKLRRTEGADRALTVLRAEEAHSASLGRHQRSYQVELAYFVELTGDYHTARSRFQELDSNSEPFDPNRRDHVMARLNHADLCMLDGRFSEADRLVVDLVDRIRSDRLGPWIDAVRMQGHIQRFSLHHQAAAALYEMVLPMAASRPAAEAKLYTNLAEALAWVSADQAEAHAETALELNGRVKNVIEQAKASAALGVALARTGRMLDAGRLCVQARKLAEEADYPAGIAIALQAATLVAAKRFDQAQALDHFRELQSLVDELGVYKHLLVLPSAYLSRVGIEADTADHTPMREVLVRTLESTNWIDREGIRRRVDAICTSF